MAVASGNSHIFSISFIFPEITEKSIAKSKYTCYNTPCVRRRTPNIGMSPSGKAPDFDSGIRRFKSCHPSQRTEAQMQICPSVYDPLAQLAEQLPFKQWVWSSNLQRVTKRKRATPSGMALFLLVTREIRIISCAADEQRSRGLDRAKPLFSPFGEKMQTNLAGVPKNPS